MQWPLSPLYATTLQSWVALKKIQELDASKGYEARGNILILPQAESLVIGKYKAPWIVTATFFQMDTI